MAEMTENKSTRRTLAGEKETLAVQKLRDQNSKLEMANKKLTAENAELKIKLDKNAVQLQGNSKDIKYVMQLLEKSNLENKKLKEELSAKRERYHDQENGLKMRVMEVRDKNTMTEDKQTDWKEEIRNKDEAISFYKEICDAKVSEVAELQHINRFLKDKIQHNNLFL